MAFNFSEEEITSMYRMYEDTLTAIKDLTQKVAQEITAKAQELKYEPVINLSIEAINYYNEDLKSSEINAMNDWQTGDASFSSIMEKMAAGESAKSRSKELEVQIEEGIQSWSVLDSSQLSGIDKKNWRCDASDFEDIKEIINRFISDLENKQSELLSMLESKKEENTIYISIEPVVLQSVAIVKEGFQAGINASFSELAQEFSERESVAKSMGESAAQSAASKSQSFVSSGVSALKAKVKTILD